MRTLLDSIHPLTRREYTSMDMYHNIGLFTILSAVLQNAGHCMSVCISFQVIYHNYFCVYAYQRVFHVSDRRIKADNYFFPNTLTNGKIKDA